MIIGFFVVFLFFFGGFALPCCSSIVVCLLVVLCSHFVLQDELHNHHLYSRRDFSYAACLTSLFLTI